MPKTAKSIADTINAPGHVSSHGRAPLAPFEDALARLRVEGNVLLHGLHSPPWAADVPDGKVLRDLMGFPSNVQIVPFHVVLNGEMELQPDGGQPVRLVAGDIAMCPVGTAHRMFHGRYQTVRRFEDVLASSLGAVKLDQAPGGHNRTDLVCGAFVLKSAPLNPLLSSLPAVLKVGSRSDEADPMLALIVKMLELELARENRNNFATSRLIEILFAEALRAHGARQGHAKPGWFRGLTDSKIGSALCEIHADPGVRWSVGALAQRVAMSPSRFAARFRDVTGQTVMTYVTSWRMSLACRELIETRKGLTEIAMQIGYQDTAAFSRAFKSAIGLSPAHWRSCHG